VNIFDRESIKRAAWRLIRGNPSQAKTPNPSQPETARLTLGEIMMIVILLLLILAVLITLFNW
jgi:hypothetical protein